MPERARTAAVPRLSADNLLRTWSDAVRVALGTTAAALVLIGRPAAAIGVVLITATAVATRLARAPAGVESAFLTLLAMDVWLTSSGAMAHIDRHDTIGHLVLTAAVTPVLAAPIGARGARAARSARRTGILAGVATIGLAIGWELAEWASDVLVGTNMSLSALDTAYDLGSGVFGAAAGGLIAASVHRRRRRPGD